MLQRIIYFSARTESGASLEQLAAEAAERNSETNITGLLVASLRWFVQVLEGEREDVNHLFQAICQDKRHANVTLVAAEEIAGYSYPEWSMNCLEDVERVARLWCGGKDDGLCNPSGMSARQIQDFLQLAAFELLTKRLAQAS